jgi:RHS repeat-associated protein
MTYDNLGRIKTRSNSTEGTTTYSYVTAGNGLGMLASVNNPTSGISNSYTYGDYSRVETVTESIDDDDYEFTYTYDELGRVSQLEYPGDFSIRYGYGNYGELKKVTDAGNQLIWEVKDVTSHGELEKIVYGNGLSTDLDYDDYHQLTDILTTNASGDKRQHLQYSFQYQTGNLLSRTDKLLSTSGITETFTYDNLDRLTSYKVGSNPAHAIAYNTDGTGRYISKTGLGVYHYGEDNAPELALTSVTGSDGTVINQAQQDISYTPFNKVERITQGTKQLEITYGIDQQRKITKLYDGTTLIKKKTFVGGLYEIEEDQAGNKRHLYYVSGPTGEAAIFVKINTGAPAPYYIHKDHQGTYQTITNASGSTVETLSFDPWGRRRNATDWTYSGIPASFTFNRGYTGHEHLDEFGLINMNGRVYDPLAGAFLSPDNFVQSPGSTQSYNRYGYCLNNPLKYSDPSGEFIRLGVIGFWAPFYILDNYLKGEQDAFMSGIRDATSAANEAFNSFQVPIYNNDNVTVTAGLDIWNFGVSVNTYYHNGDWSGGIGVGVGVFGGFNYHANGGLSYSPDDDVTISAGAGVGSNHWGWNASVKYNGYGVGYGQTYYGNAIGPDGLPNNQTVGTFSLFFNNNSLTIQNDFLGDKHDRWRSNAVELTIGNFAIGTWLYNNDPASEGKGFDLFGTNRQGKMNRPVNGNQRFGTWNNGKVYQSPIYFGIRSGNTVDRIGYSSPWVQEYTQNTVHRWVPFGRQNFYTEDSDFRYGLYLYAGYHNPFSLWQTINW